MNNFLYTINFDSVWEWLIFQVNFTLFEEMPELLPKKVLKNFKKYSLNKAAICCTCDFSNAEMEKAQIIADGMIKWALGTKSYPTLGKTQKKAKFFLSFYFGLGKCKTYAEAKKYLTQLGIECE